MADKPILFSAPMVRALIDGSKTQTRRIIKPQPVGVNMIDIKWPDGILDCDGRRLRIKPGDRLYVREAWRTLQGWDCIAPRQLAEDRSKITYEADPNNRNPLWVFGKFRQAMHMPRWASRITLIVEGVKVERLRSIIEADAIAEGAPLDPSHHDTTQDGSNPHMVALNAWTKISPVAWYHRLWDEINGPGSWASNPFVAAYSFKVHHCNIDAMAEDAR